MSEPSQNQNQTSKLQQWLEQIWYQKGKGYWLLMPLSVLYCAVNTYQRNTQFKALGKHPPHINVPIIVVGNITVGGTGKTPVTVHIVNMLKKMGYKPAIITRGYGGKAQIWPQRVFSDSDAKMVGDEAVLMAIRTGVAVYAGANRVESIQLLQKETDCDVIVSDDGMQHYKMPRDIQVAVIDGERGFGNEYCIPAGPLREKLNRLDSCDLLVLNGVAKTEHDRLQEAYTMSLSGDTIANLANLDKAKESSTQVLLRLSELSSISVKRVHAVTGIGNPNRFYTTLEKAGLTVHKHSFPDHHAFNKNDLLFDDNEKVIMTEKDAVKCRHLIAEKTNYWYLPISAVLPKEFDDKLLSLLKAKSV